MTTRKSHEPEALDTSSTVRIDRRQTVLAQIEGALLANKLAVLELVEQNAGSDPYNRVPRVAGSGNLRRAR